MWITTVVAIVLALGSAGCASDDSVTCTLELRSPITVEVTSPEGRPIDAVTAERRHEAECDGSVLSERDGGPTQAAYWCYEQGGGTYVVRVKSGDLTWTQRTHVTANECHTTSSATLSFVLDPDTAD